MQTLAVSVEQFVDMSCCGVDSIRSAVHSLSGVTFRDLRTVLANNLILSNT